MTGHARRFVLLDASWMQAGCKLDANACPTHSMQAAAHLHEYAAAAWVKAEVGRDVVDLGRGSRRVNEGLRAQTHTNSCAACPPYCMSSSHAAKCSPLHAHTGKAAAATAGVPARSPCARTLPWKGCCCNSRCARPQPLRTHPALEHHPRVGGLAVLLDLSHRDVLAPAGRGHAARQP